MPHAFPTRRSSDLVERPAQKRIGRRAGGASGDEEDAERGKTAAPPSKFKEQAAGQQGCHPQCRCEAGTANTGSVGLSDHDVKLEADHRAHRNEDSQQVAHAAMGEIEEYYTTKLCDEKERESSKEKMGH